MKVAAYQMPIAACYAGDAISLIRDQISRCEALGVEILCCPEAAVGGLADYVDAPSRISLRVETGQRDEILGTLASRTVTTIVGFTEVDEQGRIFNAAAVLHAGSVLGIYRKLHPAIHRSVYTPGIEAPVFTVGTLTFGIVICRDSAFAEPIGHMIACGASVLFIPTNNGMPASKGGSELVDAARQIDIAHARRHGVAIVRSDVVGRHSTLASWGATSIVDRSGDVVAAPAWAEACLIIASLTDAMTNQ